MAENKQPGFFESFLLSGAVAGISKTAAAPMERVKLLVQCQNEMIKQVLMKCEFLLWKDFIWNYQGRLEAPYKGVWDCTKRVFLSEGVFHFWRGR